MTDNFLEGILNYESPVKIPTGGTFVNSGLIAPWRGAPIFSFVAPEDIDEQLKEEKLTFLSKRTQSNGTRYFFLDYAQAKQAKEMALPDDRFGPEQAWHFDTEVDHVLNLSDEGRDKFKAGKGGGSINYDVRVMSFGRFSKSWHDFHLILQPSAVAAVAKVLDYTTPGYSLEELLSPDAIFDDDFREKIIGKPENNAWRESVLGQRRAALWEALGEKRVECFNPIPRPGEEATKFDTGSEKLSQCLQLLKYAWSKPVWARLQGIPDPRVDSVYNGNRMSIQAIVEVFKNESEAKKVAQVEMEAREAASASTGKSDGEKATASANGKPTIPADWAGPGMEGEWEKAVRELKGQYKGKPKPVVLKALKADPTYAAYAEDVVAWLDHV